MAEIPPGRENRPTVSGTEYHHAREKGWVRSWRPQTKTRRLLGRNDRIDWRKVRDDGIAHLRPSLRFVSEGDFADHGGAEADDWEIDPTIGQRTLVEVWCEAAGMTRQLRRVTDRYGIPIYSGGGFDSLTAVYETVERIARRDEFARRGRNTVVLAIGDLDNSGRSIIDAFAADVWAFLSEHKRRGEEVPVDGSGLLDVEHVAVTEAQIDEFGLPTQPPNPKDKRGDPMERTVQAEALAPDQLADALQQAIERRLDLDMLDQVDKLGGLEHARVVHRFHPRRWIERWRADGEIPPGREIGGQEDEQ
jgi:hypothetical protein